MGSQKRIYSISMVKNEMDIIESFIRYNTNILDGMIILDNGSTDKTLNILKKLQKEKYNLHLYQDENREFDKVKKMTQLLKKAVEEYNADIIIPLDADEFIISKNKGNPRKHLETIQPHTYHLILWKTYIPYLGNQQHQKFIPSKITHTREENIEQFYKVLIPKNLVKKYDVKIARGSHDLEYDPSYDDEIKKIYDDNLRIAHFPIRSIEQTISKITIGWLNALSSLERKKNQSHHWKKMFDHLKNNEKISKEDIIKYASEFALSNEGIEVEIKEDPIDLSFCKNIDLKYTQHQINPLANLLEACEWISINNLNLKKQILEDREINIKNQEYHNNSDQLIDSSKNKLGGYEMNRMWKTLMLPIIEKIDARYIVEIGSDKGLNTLNILNYCVDNDARMTAIDPFPKFDEDEFKAEYADKFEIFKDLSLKKLPDLKDYDVILIDGDHNWYTVYNELKLIENSFKNNKFPLVFLHDIGWPYGRRDLYYNPDNVPENYRQPYKRSGIYPGQKRLSENGGLNQELFNAIYEDTPKNGVLTAVEDFIKESSLKFSFKIIPAFFGLGILYLQDKELDKIVNEVLANNEIINLLEEERIKLSIQNNALKTKLGEIKAKSNISESTLSKSGKYQAISEKQHNVEQTQNELNKVLRELDYLKSHFYEWEYYYNNKRSITQRFFSKFPSLYILLQAKNKGIKNALTNIKGYRAIKKHNLLDVGYYLKNNKDVHNSGMDPILHYLYHGYKEGRNPNPSFNSEYYLNAHNDVKNSNLQPLIHYALYGIQEGRKTIEEGKKEFTIPKTKLEKNKLRGNIKAHNSAISVIKGWLAKIGDLDPREAILKIGGHDYEIVCDQYSADLKNKGINEGNHAFEFIVPFNFIDGEKYQIKLIDKLTGKLIIQEKIKFNQKRKYKHFSEFLANSLTSPIIFAPFREQDKRCFATMENVKKYLTGALSSLNGLPLVSVIMDVTKGVENVSQTIESILEQTYPQFELILIVNEKDGDLKHLFENISNINIVFIEKTDNSINAKNCGLEAAKGDYVTYLDPNNTWSPHFLEAMIGAFMKFNDAEALYCGQLLFKNGAKEPFAIRYGSLNISLLNNRNYIDLNSVCHKRDIINKVGYFDESLDYYADWDWMMRVVDKTKVYSLPILLSNCYENSLKNGFYLKDDYKTYSLRAKQKKRLERNNDWTSETNLKRNISIIIPSYQALEDIRECIESLLKLKINEYLEIIVVDNASSKEVIDYLKELSDKNKIKLIQNDINYGFTYAVKQGIDISNPENDIIILNNDAIIGKGAIESMQNSAYNLSDCGLIVPQQVLMGGNKSITLQVPYANPQFECDVNPSHLFDNIINVPLFHSGKTLELNFAPFFCVYIKREVYENTVGLDEELGRHYRSDRIFCYYIQHVLKLKIYHVADAIVYHKMKRSTDALSEYKSEFDIIFHKNQWDSELAKKLGYKNALWDFD